MGIPDSFAPIVISNAGAWEEDADGWFSSPINSDIRSYPSEIRSPALILGNFNGDLILNVESRGGGKYDQAIKNLDHLYIFDKNGTLIHKIASWQSIEVILPISGSPYSLQWANSSGWGAIAHPAETDNLARINLIFRFHGDFTTINQADYDSSVFVIGEATLTQGVGLQVTGIAYYPATQFTVTDSCTLLDASNNVVFEYTGECYAVDSGTYTYLFDANREILFSAPDVKSYLKMTGLVEQINIEPHAFDYSTELFKAQFNTVVGSAPKFINPNSTKETSKSYEPVGLRELPQIKIERWLTHDRLKLLDENNVQYLAGRIKGTVKQENIPAIKKVLCFTEYGQLVAETFSDKMGNFEFKELRHDKKYMITTLAGHEPNSPPDYHPDTVGYITPTAYKL